MSEAQQIVTSVLLKRPHWNATHYRTEYSLLDTDQDISPGLAK